MIVLKIAGITLLVLLCIIILLLLLLLFVPIRYNATGRKDTSYRVDFHVSWLLHLVRCKGHFDENGLGYRLKALIFTLSESDDEGTA